MANACMCPRLLEYCYSHFQQQHVRILQPVSCYSAPAAHPPLTLAAELYWNIDIYIYIYIYIKHTYTHTHKEREKREPAEIICFTTDCCDGWANELNVKY